MTRYDIPILHDSLKKGSGLMADLSKSMSIDDIKSMEIQGYIKKSYPSSGPTWTLTRKGSDTRRMLQGEKTLKLRISDFLLRYILRMRIEL